MNLFVKLFIFLCSLNVFVNGEQKALSKAWLSEKLTALRESGFDGKELELLEVYKEQVINQKQGQKKISSFPVMTVVSYLYFKECVLFSLGIMLLNYGP